jgi:lipopolysaccharide/colanic/teichoic acid biosynthesis glycosyltransferase
VDPGKVEEDIEERVVISYPVVKRLFDAAASAAGLVVVSPILAAAIIAVKLDSPGPAFFGHERIGRAGKKFKVWKLRTMVPRAEEQGPQVTVGGDARITRVGRVLRKTKIDELPQLINVLMGDMSLVGPRPEVERYVKHFADDYQQILKIQPGITDEASIEYRDEEAVLSASSDPEREYIEVVAPRKIALYKRYVQEMSLTKDLSILFRTIWKVVRP